MGTPGSFTAAAISNLVHGDLGPQIKSLTRDTEQFKQTAQEAAQAALNMLPPGKADELVSKIQGMTFGWNGASTALQKFQLIAQYMPQTLQNVVASLGKQQKAVDDVIAKIQSAGQRAKDFVATHDKSSAERLAYYAKQALAKNPDVSDRDKKRLQDALRQAQPYVRSGEVLKAHIKAQKGSVAAAKQQAAAYASIQNSQDAQIQSLNAELASSTKASSAQKKLNLMLAGGSSQFRKLSKAEQAETIAKQRQIVALTKQKKAQDEAKESARSFAVLHRQLAEMSDRQAASNARMIDAVGHGSQWNQRQQAIESIRGSYERMRKEADRAYAADKRNGVDATIAEQKHARAIGASILAEQQAVAAQRNAYAALDAERLNVAKGWHGAIEDIRDSWSDAASQMRDVTTSAFNGMADSIANFVTTGKGNFGDLVNSIINDMIKMEVRVLASQILTSIFGGATSGSGTFYSLGGSASSYAGLNNGTYGGGVSLAGGRANGGPVGAGKLYEVAEGGKPELLTSGTHTYLMMGSKDGKVSPAVSGGSASGGGGNVYLTVENNVAPANARMEQSHDGQGNTFIKVIMDAVDNRMAQNASNPSSKFRKALSATTNVRRVGVPVGG